MGDDLTFCPKTFVKSVASGRAPLTVQEAVDAPGAVGKQTYPWVPRAWPTTNAVLPAGGVMSVGVGGGVTDCAAA